MKLVQKVKANAKKLMGIGAAAITTGILSVVASAEETANSGATAALGIVNSAGTEISAAFSSLVTGVIPVVVTISMIGLGAMAVSALFKLVKKGLGSIAKG